MIAAEEKPWPASLRWMGGPGVPGEGIEAQRNLVRPERFELPTYCSGGNRSIHLSYGRTGTFSLHGWAEKHQREDVPGNVLTLH